MDLSVKEHRGTGCFLAAVELVIHQILNRPLFMQQPMRQPFSGMAERIFMKLLPNDTRENGVCNVVPPPGEWRMLICVIYAMTLVQSPEGHTHGGGVIKSCAGEWI